MLLPNGYDKVFGVWEVTTEGDCEDRTVKNLGVFIGYVDEIALHLADKAYYSLKFKRTEDPYRKLEPTNSRVQVLFDIKSDTWGISPDKRATLMQQVFKDRPVDIIPGSYFAAFTIITKDQSYINKARALAKLTYDEKVLLGLVDD